MPSEKPREIAARLLLRRHHGQFIESLLDQALARSELKAEDRRFLQELVYGVVRWELTLDWLIAQKTGGKPQKDFVRNLLRLALYQMFWLERVPSYAAVNETVEICKRQGLIPQARFINAVLRGYGREAEKTRAQLAAFRQSGADLSLGYSHPEWLCQRWEKRWGREQTAQLLDWNNSPPPTFARVNTLKTDASVLAERWKEENVQFESSSFDWAPAGTIFRLLSHPPLAGLATFQEGLFYIQDPSTLLAPRLLQVEPGLSVLDLCAAPGGKTTFIAQLIENSGSIDAEDLDPARLQMVAENARRLGAASVSIQPGKRELFDRILLDAPCSNTGVMRRRVELRWRIKPEEIQRLAITQLELLQRAAPRLVPGGKLVYSTCSMEPEENQEVLRRFVERNPSFQIEEERQLTPMSDGVDGAYAARLGKNK